jgi:hypothetical protein
MTTGALLWFIVFGLCTGVFFGIALVVTIRGVSDLRNLLGTAQHAPDRR